MTRFWPKIQILRNFHGFSLGCMASSTLDTAFFGLPGACFGARQAALCASAAV
jgi:hypothetical protein